MATAPRVVNALARGWGRALASYSVRAVRPERTMCAGRENMPPGPTVFAAWHANELLGLAFFQKERARPCGAFAPPGFVGAVMTGWLEALGFAVFHLPAAGTGNPQAALRQAARALRGGADLVIAPDGPRGPARQARPGAVWLARLSGCPLVPAGLAARPAFSLPRWDRLLVPLPGAQVVGAIGTPVPVDGGAVTRLAAALDAVTAQAWQRLNAPAPIPLSEGTPT